MTERGKPARNNPSTKGGDGSSVEDGSIFPRKQKDEGEEEAGRRGEMEIGRASFCYVVPVREKGGDLPCRAIFRHPTYFFGVREGSDDGRWVAPKPHATQRQDPRAALAEITSE